MPITVHEVRFDSPPFESAGLVGPPIPVALALPTATAGDFAEAAARWLDDAAVRDGSRGVSAADLDDTGHVVEVRGWPGDVGPRRYRVRCELVRRYRATREG